MIQKTQPNVSLPRLDGIEDEKVRKLFEEYNKIFFEMIPAIYSDISSINERLNTLEE
jgi:hypothetical protein